MRDITSSFDRLDLASQRVQSSAVGGEVANIAMFDGVRGLLAFWVYMSHVLALNGATFGPLSHGGVAVDLFMWTSGFLMVWNFRRREHKEPMFAMITWRRFYVRRAFRVAPLYYLAYAFALATASLYSADLKEIYSHFGDPFNRPFAACGGSAFLDVVTHLSFTFGLHPCFAASNVLPDWSLSLEAQFYLLFPLLLMLFVRWGLGAAVVTTVVVWLSSRVVTVYALDPSALLSMPQPSLLPLRLNCFAAGMLLGDMLSTQDRRNQKMLALAILYTVFQRHTFTAVAASLSVLLFAGGSLFHRLNVAAPLRSVRASLEARWMRRFGEVSYGFYLLHLLVLVPVTSALLSLSSFRDLASPAKVLITIVATLPVALLLSMAAHRLVEVPMIELGRTLSGRIR